MIHITQENTERLLRDRSGRIYAQHVSGSLVRISPVRPWRGKSERRTVLKHRQMSRELALQS